MNNTILFTAIFSLFLLSGCEAKIQIQSEPTKEQVKKEVKSLPAIGTTSSAPVVAKSYTTSFGRPVYYLKVKPPTFFTMKM